MTRRVVLVTEAEQQLREIDRWWLLERRSSPDLFLDEIAQAIELLADFPRYRLTIQEDETSRSSQAFVAPITISGVFTPQLPPINGLYFGDLARIERLRSSPSCSHLEIAPPRLLGPETRKFSSLRSFP